MLFDKRKRQFTLRFHMAKLDLEPRDQVMNRFRQTVESFLDVVLPQERHPYEYGSFT